MAAFTIGGNPSNTIGALPGVGEKAPDFLLTKTDLTDISLKDVAGKKIVLNSSHCVGTSVCSASVRRFNSEISRFPNAVVLCASLDLPFAHSRFCESEGIKDVIPVTELRNRVFGDRYGVRIIDGPLAGLLARAVVVIDENQTVIYSKLIAELKNEPAYEDVLEARKTGSSDEDICMSSSTAEHSRARDTDDPCDDGRAG